MKKTTLMIAILLAACLTSFAISPNEIEKEVVHTVGISGQIVDHITGEALTGVKVKVSETNDFSYTDFDGRFTINGLLPGSYQVSTTFISYQDTDVQVEAKENQSVKLRIAKISR